MWADIGGLTVTLFLGLVGAGWISRSGTKSLRTLSGELDVLGRLPEGDSKVKMSAHVGRRVAQYLEEVDRPRQGWEIFHGVVWVAGGTTMIVGVAALALRGDQGLPPWVIWVVSGMNTLLVVSILQRIWRRLSFG